MPNVEAYLLEILKKKRIFILPTEKIGPTKSFYISVFSYKQPNTWLSSQVNSAGIWLKHKHKHEVWMQAKLTNEREKND